MNSLDLDTQTLTPPTCHDPRTNWIMRPLTHRNLGLTEGSTKVVEVALKDLDVGE